MISPRCGRTIETQLVTGLMCPLCGRSLVPMEWREELMFHCKSGHQLHVSTLIKNAPLPLRFSLANLLRMWETDLENLTENAKRASHQGHFHIADIFLRQIPRLTKRAQAFRAALRNSCPELISGSISGRSTETWPRGIRNQGIED